MYRIGVISDTHNKLSPATRELLTGVEEIWHLGDVCREALLDELRAIQPRLTLVLGNNDLELDYPLTLDLVREGERFHLVHIPPRRPPAHCDWLLYGHTHVPVNRVEANIHFFNPGSAGKANKGAPLSLGFLTKMPGEKFTASVFRL